MSNRVNSGLKLKRHLVSGNVAAGNLAFPMSHSMSSTGGSQAGSVPWQRSLVLIRTDYSSVTSAVS